MDAVLLYKALLEEIDAEQRALAKKREFADFLSQRLGSVVDDTVKRSSEQDEASEVSAVRHSRRTLRQAVEEVVRSFGSGNFVVGDVYEVLLKSNEPLPESPKSKIATVLARLADGGALELVQKGGGNIPNLYRSAPDGAADRSLVEQELDDLGL